MLTSRFGPICSIALGSSKEMDRRRQLPSRASGSSSSLMAVRLELQFLLGIRVVAWASPKTQNHADYVRITAGICDQRDEGRGHFAQQQSLEAHVRRGS